MERQQKPAAEKSDRDFPWDVTVTVSPPKDGTGERYCQVEPSVVRVHHGGTVTFKVESGCGPLEVFVPTPPGACKAFPWVLTRLFTVPAKEGGRKLRVSRGKVEQEYPYAVYCRECNCFGRGSIPQMIIGPKSV